MKPAIIALKGRANCGKTKTLLRVISEIEKMPGAKIEKKEPINGEDVLSIIRIGNTKIGFTTQGDPNSTLQINLKILIEINCKIVVCACRTKGSTVDAIQKYEGACKILPFIRQDYADEAEAQVRIQETKAAEILRLINEELQYGLPKLVAA